MATPFFQVTNKPGTCAPVNIHCDEKLLLCPYDKSHLILDIRFLAHLQKCRKAYLKRRQDAKLDNDMEVCPYDYNHHIHIDKFKKHVNEECPTAIEGGLIDGKLKKEAN